MSPNQYEPARGTDDGSVRLRASATGWVFAYLRHAREEARRAGLSLPQRFIMGTLLRAGPVPVSRLTEWTGATPAAISGVLDGLDGLGFLTRRHGIEDRRQVIVALSPLGRRRAARLDSFDRERWRAVRAEIAPGEAEVASGVLDRLTAGFAPPAHRPRPGRASVGHRPTAALRIRRGRGAGAA